MKKLFSILSMTLLFVGCGNKDMDKVGNAQQCLDKSTSDTAASCLTEIENLEFKEAYLVKCAGGFIMEGFDDPTRLVNAIKSSAAGAGGITSVFSILAFYKQTDASVNLALAEKTYANCKASENSGYSLIASLSNMATKITGGSHTPETMFSAGNLATTIQNIQDPATLGAIAVAAYQASCSSTTTGGTDSNQDICNSLSTYNASTASDKEVGCCLKEKMSNSSNLCDSSNSNYTTCLSAP